MKINWKQYIYGAILGFTINGTIEYYITNKIPRSNNIQEGYINPSKLEIILEDIDKNKQNEVIMKYDEKYYLFMIDQYGDIKLNEKNIK